MQKTPCIPGAGRRKMRTSATGLDCKGRGCNDDHPWYAHCSTFLHRFHDRVEQKCQERLDVVSPRGYGPVVSFCPRRWLTGARYDGIALREDPRPRETRPAVGRWRAVTADLGAFEPPIMTRRYDADGMVRSSPRGESALCTLPPAWISASSYRARRLKMSPMLTSPSTTSEIASSVPYSFAVRRLSSSSIIEAPK